MIALLMDPWLILSDRMALPMHGKTLSQPFCLVMNILMV